MRTTDLFKIDGIPMLAPDAEVGFSYEDLDGDGAGRDESGYMHRIMVRGKVGSWSFTYSNLTEEEKQYMENLFGNKAEFRFTAPSRLNAAVPVTVRAYRSKYGISWRNARTGLWSSYSFSIIEC